MKDLIHPDECYEIIGACFEVYKEKGGGFLESVFQECLELEFGFQEMPFDAQRVLRLGYKGHPLKQGFIADFVCFDKIMVVLALCGETFKRTSIFNSQILKTRD